MSSVQLVWLSIAVSALCVVALFLRGGARSILPYVALYFAFFGLGPAINFARNEKIYFRIDVDDIGKASIGLALALVGISVAGLLTPTRTHPLDHAAPGSAPKRLPLLSASLFGLSAYALLVIAARGPQMLQVDKNARVEIAGAWHYRYLLLEFCACSLYFLARHRALDRAAYWANLGCYTAYCLVTRERDFIFVVFALLLYTQILQRKGNLLALAAAAGTCIFLATYLTSLRNGRDVGITSALNEGSVLIVDTLVVGLVPSTFPFQMGQTYLDGVLSILPGGAVGERESLAEWLIATVAPSSRSGYGFSMTAEAYMNFGTLAIPVVFGALTAIQQYLLTRAHRGPFAVYVCMLFTLTWMYNFRGESRAFIVSIVWGVAFYGAVNLLARRPAGAGTGSRRTRLPGARRYPPQPAGRHRPLTAGARDRPARERPVWDRPAWDRPARDRPVWDRPAPDRPAWDRPVWDRPAPDRPAWGRPTRAGNGNGRPDHQRLPVPGGSVPEAGGSVPEAGGSTGVRSPA